MSILDRLLLNAPGILAKGMAGQRAGEEMRFKRQIEEREQQAAIEDRQRRIQMEALREALMRKQIGAKPRTPTRVVTTVENGKKVQKIVPDEPGSTYEAAPEEPPAERNIDPLSPEGEAARKRMAAYEASLRPKSQGAAGLKSLPPATRTQISLLKSGLGDAMQAIKSFAAGTGGSFNELLRTTVQGDKNITGPITGRFFAPVAEAFGKANPEAMSARADLSRLTSAIRHKILGAALTPSEMKLVEPSIPNQNQDEAKVLNSLQGLIPALERVIADRLQAFEGYDTSMFQDAQQAEGSGRGSTDAAAELAASKKRGEKPAKYKENPY